jgi:ABC-type multidrug transport system ATPase subunit
MRHGRENPPVSTTPRLQLAHITKRYPAVVANSDVSLLVQPGETHAVLGENGAGKSTLMKIIYGAVKPDEGSVIFDGRPVQIRNPQEARALGISMVFQHFSLFDTLTVAENVWLGLDKSLALKQVTQSITAKAREYGLDVDPSRPVHTLSVGEMQRVEIIRALLTDPKLLILDEPTSVLTPQAVEKLFVVLRQLASEGCSILYISHKLHEIRELCSACTVLRGGKVTGVCDPRRETNASLSRLMIGAEPPQLEHHDRQPGAVVLRVQGLTLPREDQFGHDLQDIGFEVREGEVVGIAGVSGNGQRELLYALSGEDTRAEPAMIEVGGTPAGRLGPTRPPGPAFRARGAAGPRRGALAGPGPQPAAHADRRGRPQRLDRHPGLARAGGRGDPPLQRQGWRPGGGRALPVRRQPAEVHRRARDRRQSQAVDRLAADLGCRRGRRRADPRRDPGAARRRLRRAGAERGTGGIVRDQRPAARDRQGALVAFDRARTGVGDADRRVDERLVGQWPGPKRAPGRAAAGERVACLSSNRAPKLRASGASLRPSWRC